MRCWIGLDESSVALADAERSAHDLPRGRDPFDRLIVRDAIATDAQLLTKDQQIRERTEVAAW